MTNVQPDEFISLFISGIIDKAYQDGTIETILGMDFISADDLYIILEDAIVEWESKDD